MSCVTKTTVRGRSEENAPEHSPHAEPRLIIERRKGLVHQQDIGFAGERDQQGRKITLEYGPACYYHEGDSIMKKAGLPSDGRIIATDESITGAPLPRRGARLWPPTRLRPAVRPSTR